MKMRKQKMIKIDDREITVKELRVKDIRQILDLPENEGDLISLLDKFLPSVTTLKRENMDEMAPSELKAIWEVFKEVNADFLAAAEHLGLGKMLGNLIRAHLNEAFANLSSVDTLTSGITDGVSS
jgi:hypothetical protein